ncbi:MAG: LysM peptidoglycan-binding domain-containing protein [Myxococcales bacterium]|jgi:spore coat assembly protein SafA
MAITVRAGDTLSGIAKRHGVSLADLIKANPQIKDPNLIYPGQQLNLPGWDGQNDYRASDAPKVQLGSGSYTVQPGDTLSAIGARFGISYQALAAMNGIADPNRIFVGQVLQIPSGGGYIPEAPAAPPSPGGKYIVQPGDTLSAIGARFGVSWSDIAAANGIANPNRIYPGQALTIPGVDAGKVSGPGSVSPAPAPGPTSGGVTVAQLRAIIPNLPAARAEQLLPHLNAAMAEAGINTPLRQAAFLAQLAHESCGLTAFEEFASGAAYEGRRDLGNTQPGDGRRYKGRGPIQLTGRYNYRAAGAALGIDLENNPERAADIDVGFRVAAWYWNSRNLNKYADARNFDAITYRINGGYNGKASRDAYYRRALQVLGA